MKKLILFLLIAVVTVTAAFSQAPQKFSYQAVVRDAGNTPVANHSVSVRISILQGDANGVAVYVENQTVSTNANGLMTLSVGDGTVVGGDIAAIDWANGPYFLKTETDPTGGTNYSIVGSQQLMSVPYALYAGNSTGGGFSGDYNDLINTPQIPTVPTNVSAFVNDAGYITAADVPHAADIPTNVSAFINDAGYVTSAQIPTVPTNVSAFVNDAGYITAADVPQAADIPTNVSAFTNDANYITLSQVPAQVPADWNATTGVSRILNKPTLFSGNYNDLTNKPTIPTIPANVSAFYNDRGYITASNIPANVSAFYNDAGYITSAEVQQAANIPTNVSAFYNDANYITLSQVPAQVPADWNATSGVSRILNKPTIPTVPTNVSSFTNDAGYVTSSQLPTVPTTVSAFINDAGYITSADVQQAANIPTNVSAFYNDANYITLSQVPAQVPADWNATTGVSRILNKPAIPTVPTNVSAFSNDAGYITYSSIPTTVSSFVNDRGYLTASDIPDQVNADWNATSGAAYIYNKPTIPTVPTNISAFNNDRNYITLAQVPDQVNADWNATSGAARILNKPTIPTVPTNVSAFNNDRGYITASSIPTNISSFVNDRGYITASSVPTNVGAFENDVHYITEAQLNAILASLNYTIDSLRDRITALETLPPTSGSVTTSQISGITEHTAVCGGEVLTDGGSAIVERGVCWSTSHNPTVNNSHTIDGAGTGTFTSTLTGLAASTTYYVRAYVVNSVGIGYGGEVSFTTLTDPCQGVSTVTDYDGNVYNTIGLGNQCWMKENLRTTHYADGTAISPGSSLSSSTRYYYNPGMSASYGYLYNWPAVKGPSSVSANNQGVCPNGWHVPADGEWSQLTDYVSSQSNYQCNSTSTNIAKALASTTGWSSGSTTCAVGKSQSSNNATGFGALPAGYYNSSGYNRSGTSATFWSATESGSSYAYSRGLNYDNATVSRYSDPKGLGYSVRCLRD